MKIEFTAAADPKAPAADPNVRPSLPIFVVDYPKSGPVLESSYLFPKVENYGVWKIHSPSGSKPVSEDC